MRRDCTQRWLWNHRPATNPFVCRCNTHRICSSPSEPIGCRCARPGLFQHTGLRCKGVFERRPGQPFFLNVDIMADPELIATEPESVPTMASDRSVLRRTQLHHTLVGQMLQAEGAAHIARLGDALLAPILRGWRCNRRTDTRDTIQVPRLLHRSRLCWSGLCCPVAHPPLKQPAEVACIESIAGQAYTSQAITATVNPRRLGHGRAPSAR